MNVPVLLRSIRFAWKRMSREYVTLFILLILPILLITIIGLIAERMPDFEGAPFTGMDYIAVSYVFAFQLFGGAYTMEYFKQDLLSERRWRIFALPHPVSTHAIGLTVAATLFSISQGLVMIVFTSLAYDVAWGNAGVVVLTLAAVALLSQLVHLILILLVRGASIAERLAEVYGFGSFVLAGLLISLPDNALFDFLGTWGNPISLAQNVIFGQIDGMFDGDPGLSLAILYVAAFVAVVIAVALGRRKPA